MNLLTRMIWPGALTPRMQSSTTSRIDGNTGLMCIIRIPMTELAAIFRSEIKRLPVRTPIGGQVIQHSASATKILSTSFIHGDRIHLRITFQQHAQPQGAEPPE